MQVSQIKELDTHAVIGGGKARSFSMADSAEFFQVLSSTLYRDKKRAMIREVICNGWDAHIISGRTDQPLEITLNDNEIVFRDFGPGIPDELIVPIYCVYGASTKVKSEKETGGFGLGSKSPFAYSDHFTVTSCHNGIKNVYALSRGGVATDGRPEIRTIVSVPTTETGITVTVPLHDKDDRAEFSRHISIVTYQGGMKVKLNDTALRTLDYDPARKQGFCTVDDWFGAMHEAPVYLLYGTVLYPVSTTDTEVYKAVRDAGELIGKNHKLVLVAPPNSVGVTPSRESLSYTDMTTDTILRLLRRAHKSIQAALPAAGKRVFAEATKDFTLDHARSSDMPSLLVSFAAGIRVEPLDIAGFIIQNEPKHVRDRVKLNYYYDGLIKNSRDLRAPLRKARWLGQKIDSTIQRYDFSRFIKLAMKLNLLDGAMIYDDGEDYFGSTRLKSIRAGIKSCGDIDRCIFIAPNKRELTSMIVAHKEDPTERTEKLYLGFVVGKRPSEAFLERIDALSEKFRFYTDEYDFAFEKPKLVRAKKPTETFHNLDDYMDDRSVVEAKLESARYFMRAYIHHGTMRIGIDEPFRYRLAKLFPGIAVVTTKDQEAKLRKAGAINVFEEINRRLSKLTKNREVQYGLMLQDHAFVEGWENYYANECGEVAVKLANKDPDIAKLIFPDRVKLGETWEETKRLISVARNFPVNAQELPIEVRCADPISLILENAQKTFGHLIVKYVHIEERLGYLSMLVNSNWVNGSLSVSAERKERLLGVIRYLQRCDSKSKLTSDNTNDAIAQKEAA
ncbi:MULTISPECIES: ATP-binding protein [unclassified Ensifer]|uniref:ATP-binding protein n=1 Tax=unclassified Ensifer TaxID=2633371 RepID=UPI000812C91D|nr:MULTISPECIES: ATP-binding protein [unclassified Ensifer]OCP21983.1 hypothetical protein BC361_25790 [Ensifer sp. LC54]OCP23237.1 hypothetical protein BC363_24975 [Ensifer sp. LC384]